MVNTAAGVTNEGDTVLRAVMDQAIEDLDDTKLEDGTFLRGKVTTVNCYKHNSDSANFRQVRVDCEQQTVNRIGGPYFKVVIQGCRGAEGSIGKSVDARSGTGTQYATVLVHYTFNKGGLPPADVFRACLRSSAARCHENKDPKGKVAVALTVTLHQDKSWINEATGEVGNVAPGAEPPKSEQQMIKDEEEAKAKEKQKGSKKKGMGKNGVKRR